MKITREFIEKHRTAKGGFSFAQCQALGAGWPPTRGWLKRAVEADHTPEAIEMFTRFATRASTKIERRAERKQRWAELKTAGVAELHSPQPPPRKKKTKPHRHADPKLPPLPCDPASDEFLASFQWRAVRMQALKRYGPRCQCCGASPATGAVMHVDHIKPRKLFPALALSLDNLQVLCHECNHGKGNWDQTDWREEEPEPDVVRLLRDIAKHG